MSVSGGSSISSFRSAGLEFDQLQVPRPGADDDAFAEDHQTAFQAGLFGVLYTVSKEKDYTTYKFAIFRVAIDFLQLFLLTVNAQYGWTGWIDNDNKGWQVVSFVQLNQFMSARGYTFFIIVLYIFAGALFANVALSIWVAYSFMQNRFEYVWPIKVLRWFSLIFYQVLDIASSTLFLMTLDCNYFGVEEELQYKNQEFPDVYCWSFPHLIHVIVASLSFLVFVTMAGLFSLAEMELNPLSRNPMAMAHTRVEVVGFGIKMVMTCVSVFINQLKWMAIIQLVLSVWNVYLYLYWVPHLDKYINNVRVACYTSFCWTALCLVFLVFAPGIDTSDDSALYGFQKNITIAMWAGLAPTALLGAVASHYRQRFFIVDVLGRFRSAPPGTKPKFIYKFTDAREVEIVARSARQWLDEDTVDPEAVEMAEQVIKAGMAMLSKQPYITIIMSSFLIDVQGSYQSGYSLLQVAKKVSPSFLESFAIFSREQQHTQKNSGANSGDASTDLVSYVEFQRNYRLALKAHREALLAARVFWQTLLLGSHSSFITLARAIKNIDSTTRQAERIYRMVLQRHSNSVKLVRLYARFLEDCRNDPWTATHWFSEADKLEQVEEESKDGHLLEGLAGLSAVNGMGEADTSTLRTALMAAGTNAKAVLIINAQCLIQFANQAIVGLFGYTRNELKGKSIAVLMPQPLADVHQIFRAQLHPGKGDMTNRATLQLALHKDRSIVPVILQLTRLSGVGEDTTWMAALEAAPQAPDTAHVWVKSSGAIISVDAAFSDWFGYKPEDVAGGNIVALVPQHKVHLQDVLAKAHAIAMQAAAAAVVASSGPSYSTRPAYDSATYTGHLGTIVVPQPQHGSNGQVTITSNGLVTTAALQPSPEAAGLSITAAGGCNAAGMEHVNDMWVLPELQLSHKFSDPVDVEISVSNGGMHLSTFQALTIRRVHAATAKNMIVVDTKGRLLHITNSLASLLGTTPAKLLADGDTGLESLMPQPFSLLHRALSNGTPSAVRPPPYSCRAGLSVLLNTWDMKGVKTLPFALHIKKQDGLVDTFHVANVQPRTLDQALEERCMTLLLDSNGVIKTVNGDASRHTIGVDPAALIGKSIGTVLDVFRPSGGSAPIDKQQVKAVMMELASRSASQPGLSWRVGMHGPMDDLNIQGLGDMAEAILGSKTVPAMMTVTLQLACLQRADSRPLFHRSFHSQHRRPSTESLDLRHSMAGNNDGSILLEVNLWRADLLTSLIMVNSDGNVVHSSMDSPLYPPGVILGVASDVLLGSPIMQYLPLPLGPNNDLMSVFDETSIAAADLEGTIAWPHMAAMKQQKRSNIKSLPSTYRREKLVGPPFLLTFEHPGETDDMDVIVQAVRSSAREGSFFLVVHPHKPRCGQPDFCEWVMATKSAPPQDFSPLEPTMPRAPADYANGIASPKARQARGPPPRKRSSIRSLLGQAQQAAATPTSATRESAKLDNLDILEAELLKGPEASTSDAAAVTGKSVRFGGDHEDEEKAPEPLKQDQSQPQQRAQIDRTAAWVLSDGTDAESPRGGQAKLASPQRNRPQKDSLRPQESALATADGNTSDAQSDTRATHAASTFGGEEGRDQSNIISNASPRAQSAAIGSESGDNITGEGDHDTDYRRGQRLKKLFRLLASSQAQKSMKRFRLHTLCMVGLLLAIHLGAFLLMVQLLNGQHAGVQLLNNAGLAVHAMSRVTILTRTLDNIVSNRTVPGLSGVNSTVDYDDIMSRFYYYLQTFHSLHDGMYLGFDSRSSLPTDLGLRDLWDFPSQNMTYFYDNAQMIPPNVTSTAGINLTQPVSVSRNVSVWDAGNQFLAKALDVYQNGKNFSLNGGIWDTWTDVKFIIANGPNAVFLGYYSTMDDLVQVVVDEAANVNKVQLIVLAVEGCCATMMALLYMWILSRQVAWQRHNIYNIFLVIPHALVRGLASRPLHLGDDDEDTADVEPVVEASAAKSDALEVAGWSNTGKAAGDNTPKRINMGALDAQLDDAARKPPGQLSRVFRSMMFWRSRSKVFAEDTKRRQLKQSYQSSLWLTWPFVCLGVLLVVTNAMGHQCLGQVASPIAVFNCINFVRNYVDRTFFYAQELMITPAGPAKEAARALFASKYALLRTEYSVMLYGHLVVPNDTRPHYTLASTGVVYSDGSGVKILYSMTGCMRQNLSTCAPPSDPYYQYTHGGVDQLMQRYFDMCEDMINATGSQPTLTGPEYNFMWSIMDDLEGGLQLLNDAYHTHVLDVYNQALTLHAVCFALAYLLLGMYLLLILRPFLRDIANETRRSAELLAQLPHELDIEGYVSRLLGLRNSSAAKNPDASGASLTGGGWGGVSHAGGGGASIRDGGASPNTPLLKHSGSINQQLQKGG